MELEYTLNPNLMEIGFLHDYKHRNRDMQRATPVMTFAALFAAFAFWLGKGEPLFVICLVILGICSALLPFILKKLALKEFHQSRPDHFSDQSSHSLKQTPVGLYFEDSLSKGEVNWSAFIDLRIEADGILLYPQKSIFLWIPIQANFIEGSWPEFIQLLERKIEKTG